MNQWAGVLDVVVTARPSWARVKTLVSSFAELNGNSSVRLSLVGPAVSERYGDISKVIGHRIKHKNFPALQESDALGSIALSAIEGASSLVRYWSMERPTAVLVIADRTETLGASVAAALMQIPLIHLQGGEVSGSIDDKIRNSNTKLADLHLTTNLETRERLLGMGEEDSRIRVIGCPSVDIAREAVSKTQGVQFLDMDKLGGVGAWVEKGDSYGVIMFHPDTLASDETNVAWIEHLMRFVDHSRLKWFWFWPNPDHGTNQISKIIRRKREQGGLSTVRFIINIEPELFNLLLANAQILLGNSSYGIRESSYLGLSVINLGDRQHGRQRGQNVLDLDLNSHALKDFRLLESRIGLKFPQSNLYGSGNSGRLGAEAVSKWEPSLK